MEEVTDEWATGGDASGGHGVHSLRHWSPCCRRPDKAALSGKHARSSDLRGGLRVLLVSGEVDE